MNRASVAPASQHVEHAVISLRLWGSDTLHDLSASPSAPLLIGRSGACAIRLLGRHTAPLHAQLTFDADQWRIQDLGTAYGVRQDGVPRSGFVLTPGVEIGIGGSTLVAESTFTRRLRAFCQRLLGWDIDRMRAVDHALRAIRFAGARRTPLVLCGEGDLVPIAYALHRLMIGHAAPFVVCDPRRNQTRASVRSPPNTPLGIQALSHAMGGTLCVRHARLPADFDEACRRAYDPDSDVQIIVCARDLQQVALVDGTLAIEVPALGLRERELSRIVQEYAEDAISTFGVDRAHFNADDRDWVMTHCARSLAEIEKATLRVIALSASHSGSHAAARLGMAPVSLARWLDRRPQRATDAKPAELTPLVRDAQFTGNPMADPNHEPRHAPRS